ncbi:hypothetical protein CHLRE_12g527250v5 [Chlamydomonas reinhardtii]|uniref:Uncharacterized protein n=1 Tax=Chlamydomonas reinhardtii TaxID=3055 RepID=A8J5E1_CHLRE|nr:uncharacterized protein CHLRE_12g527250v5 [Chlamydomonas reinhardtii]PNW75458.1 hypothetical protein CHLRE_12g527250v5 [Chlamydomonas reinhardtii]|eukprot:XP_001696876.1 predicted protein [Chlamydomonas reinhardtii]
MISMRLTRAQAAVPSRPSRNPMIAMSRRPAPRSVQRAAHSGSNFALETMSEDGQGWVWDELSEKLVGLKHRTPRATCKTTSLISYRGNLSCGRKALRVHELDLELTWEATAGAAEGCTFTGLATIKFGGSEDGQDVVDVEVAVDPHCLSALPEQREKVVKDVVYAVESMDAAIMVQLNDFLWNMEKRNRLCELESSMHVSKAELAPARAAPAPAPASPAPSFVPGMAPAFA